ncbi:hypothetical protein KILIM_108_00080 [Kineosphaera limosa NBRC 100340]|uniref:Uncharacterized protein n=1 Tax=Kineosphaera limosa NBRC 100340 TaxID=1184609 RepID=K6XH55_9MICO|nr:hypothetical protein KILIM_108_00080 [Kineosphaera limosa NBRC 100340]
MTYPGVMTRVDQVRGWFTAEATLWTDVDRFLAREAVRLARQFSGTHTVRRRTSAWVERTPFIWPQPCGLGATT